MREATVAEETRSPQPSNPRHRPAGQDWLKSTEGHANPAVDEEWINGYRELLRYAVKPLASTTPSSFRHRRRPTDHLGFSAPATLAAELAAPRQFFWSSVSVGSDVKKNREGPLDRSSSPLDTSEILQRWLRVLSSVEE